MDPLTQWSIDFIKSFQALAGGGLTPFFEAASFLGNQEFFLLLLPAVLWCYEGKLGLRLAFLLLFSAYLNIGLKELFKGPRPLDIDASLLISRDEDAIYAIGYGMPSGHAQWSASNWGAVAIWFGKRWVWVVALLITLLVGLARIYLGAHFPLQVVTGWVIGALFLIVFLTLYLPVEKWLASLSFGWQLLVAVAFPALMVALLPVADSVATTAILMGGGVGQLLGSRWLGRQLPGTLLQRILSYLIGVIVLVAIYAGLSVVFPERGANLYVPFRFLRYALLGTWLTLGAPALFRSLRLSTSDTEAAVWAVGD